MKHDWFWTGMAFAAGFAAAVLVGARNGEQMAAEVGRIVETCEAQCSAMTTRHQTECMDRFEVVGDALRALGDRCVLSVPVGDRVRVERTVWPLPMGLPDDPED